MCDEGGWSLRQVSVAAAPRVGVDLMQAAVSGEWVVQTGHAAMETAVLCAAVSHGIAPERAGDRNEDGGVKQKQTKCGNGSFRVWNLSSRVRCKLPW